ncbi:MAG: hypothetical protein KKC55_16265 [Gammaproteobacteria bacterium]|nr:hypothetical protein [Gammaproteobacteria bacterium]
MREDLLKLQKEYLENRFKEKLELGESKRHTLNHTIVFGTERQFIHYHNLYESMNYDMRNYTQTYRRALIQNENKIIGRLNK